MKEHLVDEQDWFGWLLGGIATVISSLGAAIVTLWNQSEKKNAEAIDQLKVRAEKCEEDRIGLRIEMHDAKQRIAELEQKNAR